jgi:molybdate transport system ATP-binding protein
MTITVRIRHSLERLALDVDFVSTGGLTALLGPSGAGKTRTLDIIAGLLRPLDALISMDGETLTDTTVGIHTAPHRRRIGYVFQDSRLFPHLTVRKNLLFGRWFTSRRSAAPAISFDEVTRLLDLEPLLGRHPGRLSGGERRRVALGRALLANPRLLLLDEPLGSLEVAKRQEILPYLDRLLSDLRLPMIYVTHDWNEVKDRAQHVVMIEHGRTTTAAPPRDAHEPRHRSVTT